MGKPPLKSDRLLVPAKNSPGWFTIQSNLVDKDSGQPLVIDIENPEPIANPITRGRNLDVWTLTGNDNQLWKFAADIPGAPGWSVIQSKVMDAVSGEPLVIDITAGSNTLGTALQVWTQNDGPNQLWQLAG